MRTDLRSVSVHGPKRFVADIPGRLRRSGAKVRLALFGRQDVNLQHLMPARSGAIRDNPRSPAPLPERDSLVALIEQFCGECLEAQVLLNAFQEMILRKSGTRTFWGQAVSHRTGGMPSFGSRDSFTLSRTGLDAALKRSSSGPFPPPEGLVIESGHAPGTAVARWNNVPRCKGYLLHYREHGTPEHGGVRLFTDGTRQARLDNLKPGACYVFRVATCYSGIQAGQSPWSPEIIREIE